MSQRLELVTLAQQEGANLSALCRQFGISRKTAYKWLERYAQEGQAGLADWPRRPHTSPGGVSKELEQAVVELRREHPAWGARKLKAALERQGLAPLAAGSTIQAILKREGLIAAGEGAKHKAYKRFQRSEPNELWQMDFKGHFPLSLGRVHPLTLLDDHSRYLLGLVACADERQETVQESLQRAFECFGLPECIICDNGSPWGNDAFGAQTRLSVWLLSLDVAVSHSSPRHPQTLGKDERLHRTLKAEALSGQVPESLPECQVMFDSFRHCYNEVRPHQALSLATPASRYRPSCRPLPKQIVPFLYSSDQQLRSVDEAGRLHFLGRRFRVGKAYAQQTLGLLPQEDEPSYHVYFRRFLIGRLDAKQGVFLPSKGVTYVPEQL